MILPAQLRTQAHEGCRLTVYDDSTGKPIVSGSVVKGNPTIGYGRLLSAPGGISSSEAEALFDADWAQAQGAAKTLPCYSRVNAVRQGILTEMVFQLGVAGVRGFAQMLAALDRQDYAGAAQQMRASRWAQQTPQRVDALAALMETGS